MIWYSNPWSSDRNFGKAINDFCRLVQDPNDWIVIQDGDICYLTSDWGARIEAALKLDGHKFGLIGCKTNRIREREHCHNSKMSDNPDMKHHSEIALNYNLAGIQETKKIVAGYFMAFQKKTFDLVGGFKENCAEFDVFFNIAMKKRGLKKGLIRSLYVWHSYRLLSKDPSSREAKKHLYG